MHLIIIANQMASGYKNDNNLNDGGGQFNDGAGHLTMAQDILTMALNALHLYVCVHV